MDYNFGISNLSARGSKKGNQSISQMCCNCIHMKKYIIKIIKEYCKLCDEDKLKELISDIVKEFIYDDDFKDLIIEVIKESCPYCDEEKLKEFITDIVEEYIGKEKTLKGIEAKMTEFKTTYIDVGDKITFDTITNDQTNGNIVYDEENKQFIIKEVGNYFVSGWVDLVGSAEARWAQFAINVNGEPYGYGSTSGYNGIGQLEFSAYITTTEPNSTLDISNAGTASVDTSDSFIQSQIIITYIG